MNNNSINFSRLAAIYVISLTLLGFSTASFAEEAAIARVIVSSGDFTAVQPDGKERVLKRRSAIFEGDTLVTAENGRAQIRFKDGALIDIQAASQLRLDEYHYEGKVDGTEKNTMSLIKGGFRTISGIVGKKNKKNYKVNTPVATIGIRGTHYGLHYCGGGCRVDTGDGKFQNKTGLYGGVVDGAVVASNDAGDIRLGNDEYFLVPSSDESPQILLTPPIIIFGADERKSTDVSGGTDSGSKNDGTQKVSMVPVDAPEFKEPVDAPLPAPAFAPPTPSLLPVVAVTSIPVPNQLLPTTKNAVVGISFLNTSGGGVHSGTGMMDTNNVSVTFNANNQPLRFYVVDPAGTADPCSPCTFDSGTATVVGAGGDAIGVNWGRWNGSFVVTKNGITETVASDFHFIYSDKMTPMSTVQSMTGDFSYNLVNASGTDQSGAVLSSVTSTVQANFNSQTFTEYSLVLTTANSEAWSASIAGGGSVSFTQAFSDNGISMSGTCVGGNCGGLTSDVTGNVNPLFVGANADGMISTYGFTSNTASSGVAGTAFYKK